MSHLYSWGYQLKRDIWDREDTIANTRRIYEEGADRRGYLITIKGSHEYFCFTHKSNRNEEEKIICLIFKEYQ